MAHFLVADHGGHFIMILDASMPNWRYVKETPQRITTRLFRFVEYIDLRVTKGKSQRVGKLAGLSSRDNFTKITKESIAHRPRGIGVRSRIAEYQREGQHQMTIVLSILVLLLTLRQLHLVDLDTTPG